MTDAPETIWTTGNSQTGSWNDSDVRHCPGTEYTRTDISQARIAELEAALVTARKDALQEAAALCTAVFKEAAEYNLPQMALGASKCGDDILDLKAKP
jgi:hypothetical protein